jgi:REP element-mobilizing transposase RayT
MDGLFRRRRLPHWDVEDGTYFVTSCLEGSIPAQGLVELYCYRDNLESLPKPPDLSEEEWEDRRAKLVFARFDDLIDRQPAVRHLEVPALAAVVRDAFYHFAGDRYDLLAFVIMPSHFHWVFHPRSEWVASLVGGPRPGGESKPRTPRERIMQGLKGYTAYRCNQLLGTRGTFWQDESYDHIVRTNEELLRIVEYVEQNPVRAGLAAKPEEWRWSSASDRLTRGTGHGGYLLK